jgi:hypothetical protein
MKRLSIVFLLLILSAQARSQVIMSLILGDKINSDKLEFGLDGGLNLSDIGGLNSSAWASRFNLGFYFDFKFKDPSWMIHTGVIVKSTMGAKDLPVYSLGDPTLDATFTGGTIERRLSYFNVPFMIKRQFRNHFFIEAGPMFGLINSAKDVFTKTVKDQDDLTYELNVRDQYHTIDAGVMGGIGYRLMGGHGMNLGFRYYQGMVDVLKSNTGTALYNRSMYFTIGIPIGKGKAEAREKAKATDK